MIDSEFYKSKNSSKTIVVLPGWGHNKESMNCLVNLLKRRYNILSVDLPGFGGSKLSKSYYIDDYVSDLEELLSTNTINPSLIIAHSFGGKVATYYSLRHNVPLLLLAPSIIKPKFSLKVYLNIKRYKFLKFLKKIRVIKKLPELGSDDYRSSKGYLRTTFLNVVHAYPNKKIKNLGNKLNVLLGKQDKAIDAYQAKKMKKYNPKANIITLDGDHFFYLNNKNYICSFVDSLLKENSL